MMKFHPLFQWMDHDPDAISVYRVTQYARPMGFSVLPCKSPIPVAAHLDKAEQIANWANFVAMRHGHGYKVAGGWMTHDGFPMALLVKPDTLFATAIWDKFTEIAA